MNIQQQRKDFYRRLKKAPLPAKAILQLIEHDIMDTYPDLVSDCFIKGNWKNLAQFVELPGGEKLTAFSEIYMACTKTEQQEIAEAFKVRRAAITESFENLRLPHRKGRTGRISYHDARVLKLLWILSNPSRIKTGIFAMRYRGLLNEYPMSDDFKPYPWLFVQKFKVANSDPHFLKRRFLENWRAKQQIAK
jgi:hypothetical protein